MSYDLYFCWRRNEIVDFNAVAAWATAVGKFQQSDGQLWYLNKETGVYFSLDFEQGKFDSPDDNIIPAGYFDSGLSFNLNYNRPSFFAHEAMPLVQELSTRFGLCIFDPQAPDDISVQCVVDRERLIHSWADHNNSAVQALVEHAGVKQDFYMPLASSMYLWSYMRQRSELQAECGEQVYVPSLVPVRKKIETPVDTAFVITQGIPTLIPQSKWIFVVRKKRVLLKAKQEVIAIGRDSFHELTRPHLRSFEWRDLGLYIVSPESAELVGKLLKDVPQTLSCDDFEILAVDSFVDVPRRSA